MEFNNNNITEDRWDNDGVEAPALTHIIVREDRRKKEVEDLISKYAKKKDKDEVICEGFTGEI